MIALISTSLIILAMGAPFHSYHSHPDIILSPQLKSDFQAFKVKAEYFLSTPFHSMILKQLHHHVQAQPSNHDSPSYPRPARWISSTPNSSISFMSGGLRVRMLFTVQLSILFQFHIHAASQRTASIPFQSKILCRLQIPAIFSENSPKR